MNEKSWHGGQEHNGRHPKVGSEGNIRKRARMLSVMKHKGFVQHLNKKALGENELLSFPVRTQKCNGARQTFW